MWSDKGDSFDEIAQVANVQVYDMNIRSLQERPGVATPGYAINASPTLEAEEENMGYWESFYHLIWTTKNREPLIDEQREKLLLTSFRATAIEKHLLIRAVGMVSDHVHVAISIPPSTAVSFAVRDLKTDATHLINNATPLKDGGVFSWQREFAMFTFGARSLEDIAEYVTNQKHHHTMGTTRPTFERLDRQTRS